MNNQFHSAVDPIINAKGVRKSYRDVHVLKGVDLQVQRGAVFALLGPNGAGKTTLVNILATLQKPDAGEITIAGYDLRKQPEAVRGVIALTGQFVAVDELLTGEENLRMMARLFHLEGAEIDRRTGHLLRQFDLAEDGRRMVKHYSGGMRRRLDLAISLLVTPSILFLDEPTTGLDPHSRQTIWALVGALAASGVTIFLTTQYLEEADQLADKIAVLHDGRIIAEGAPHELKQQVGQEYVDLTFTRSQDVQPGRQLLGSQVIQYDEQARSLRMAFDGSPRQLNQILTHLEQAAIDVESLALRKPTLDDVFFVLTQGGVSNAVSNGGNDD